MNSKIKDIKILIVTCLLCVCCSEISKAQTFNFFIDDDLFSKVIDTLYPNDVFFVREYKLKDKLPSGEYIVYNCKNPKKSKTDVSNFIILKGQYVDSLKTGVFYFYEFSFKGNEKVRWLLKTETYKNGVLNGLTVEYDVGYRMSEEHYLNGKKDGFSIYYNKNGDVSSISQYEYGEKKAWAYYENGITTLYGRFIDPVNVEITDNDNQGNRKNSVFYCGGELCKIIDYSDNGNISCIKEGNFERCPTSSDIKCVILSKVISGKITYFDNKGNFIKTEEIK